MICDVCWKILRGQSGRQWRGTYDLHFQHHVSEAALNESASKGCSICRLLKQKYSSLSQSAQRPEEIADRKQKPFSISASLSKPFEIENAYRLDFKIDCHGLKDYQTFVLKECSTTEHPKYRTPLSYDTSSDECLGLASQWLHECTCETQGDGPSWYPARLINLSKLKGRVYLEDRLSIAWKQGKPDVPSGKVEVQLERTSEWDSNSEGLRIPPEANRSNNRYVTLSHCWGTITKESKMLTASTLGQLMKGIAVGELPKTFQHAIQFASRLDRVGYIWIDSLCIMQGSDESAHRDWLAQSAEMDKVYNHAYLNISATAAENSHAGLFLQRNPELLWEDEINLNIAGLPRWSPQAGAVVVGSGDEPSSLKRKLTSSWGDPTIRSESGQIESKHVPSLSRGSSLTSEGPTTEDIRRCIIIDVSLWDGLVHQAPINRRGWVLQERLMAPRVLHFCKDQIAWECAEYDASESRPRNVPTFRLEANKIVEETRLKGLDPSVHGKELRTVRLRGCPDPDVHLGNDRFAFELWARIVQVYSNTRITKPTDKLIALAGIARAMSTKFEPLGKGEMGPMYVAGMWRKYLESQLLWKVEPTFHSYGQVRRFANPSIRRTGIEYRAPSFSWASVDTSTEFGAAQGIVYGEVTDRDLLIKVDHVQVKLEDPQNEFGLVSSGHLFLWGQLRRIKLFEDIDEFSAKKNGHHYWKLQGGIGDEKEVELDMLREEHTNVYLDCPTQDGPQIFRDDADTYCVPAAYGERKEPVGSKYLICLLLQKDKSSRSKQIGGNEQNYDLFRRIGLTKLSAWNDKLAYGRIIDYKSLKRTLICLI